MLRTCIECLLCVILWARGYRISKEMGLENVSEDRLKEGSIVGGPLDIAPETEISMLVIESSAFKRNLKGSEEAGERN